MKQLKDHIKALSLQLRSAKPKEVYDLLVELQRSRVSLMTLREIHTDQVEPDLYREMSLLNRLLKTQGLDDRPDPEDLSAADAATEMLATRGITPAQAPGILRALESIMAGVDTKTKAPDVQSEDVEIPHGAEKEATRGNFSPSPTPFSK